MRTLTIGEANEEYERTGKGVDMYREFRDFIAQFVETIPGLIGHEPVLLHAWLVHDLARGFEQTPEGLQKSYGEWMDCHERRKFRPLSHKKLQKKPEETKPTGIITTEIEKRYVTVARPQWPTALYCLHCSKPLDYDGSGRKPKYCDNSCKMKAYRARKKQK